MSKQIKYYTEYGYEIDVKSPASVNVPLIAVRGRMPAPGQTIELYGIGREKMPVQFAIVTETRNGVPTKAMLESGQIILLIGMIMEIWEQLTDLWLQIKSLFSKSLKQERKRVKELRKKFEAHMIARAKYEAAEGKIIITRDRHEDEQIWGI